MSDLFELQTSLTVYIAQLIVWANQNGYRVTFGDAYRDPRAFGKPGYPGCSGYGHVWSNHKHRCAVDLNLFKSVDHAWVYCPTTEEHRPLGEYWESIAPECRWGGRFNDGNHYEVVYKERQ